MDGPRPHNSTLFHWKDINPFLLLPTFHFRLAGETHKKINGGKTLFSILELLKRFYFFEMVSIKEMFPGSFSRQKNVAVCFDWNKKELWTKRSITFRFPNLSALLSFPIYSLHDSPVSHLSEHVDSHVKVNRDISQAFQKTEYFKYIDRAFLSLLVYRCVK